MGPLSSIFHRVVFGDWHCLNRVIECMQFCYFVFRICAFVMVYFSPIETTCGFIEFEMCFSNPNMDQLNLLNKEKMDQKMCVTFAKQDYVSNSCEF